MVQTDYPTPLTPNRCACACSKAIPLTASLTLLLTDTALNNLVSKEQAGLRLVLRNIGMIEAA
jgi:hypothetical protein